MTIQRASKQRIHHSKNQGYQPFPAAPPDIRASLPPQSRQQAARCQRLALPSIVLLRRQASALTRLLPRLDLAPRTLALGLELVVAGAQLGDGLLGQQLLQRPLLDVLVLVLLELGDELDGALQD